MANHDVGAAPAGLADRDAAAQQRQRIEEGEAAGVQRDARDGDLRIGRDRRCGGRIDGQVRVAWRGNRLGAQRGQPLELDVEDITLLALVDPVT